jgi:hypothetical protein
VEEVDGEVSDAIGCGALKLGAPCMFISRSNALPTHASQIIYKQNYIK